MTNPEIRRWRQTGKSGNTLEAWEEMMAVDGPAHYGGADNPYETIKVMVAWFGVEHAVAFCKMNAIKYLSRAGRKGSEAEDLQKAAWYSTAAANLIERGEIR